MLDQRQYMYFAFLQDDWKVTPRLTLNLGTRYEFATPVLEKNNRFANFDPATGTMVFAKSGSLYERSLIHPDLNNWAPRLGFAYSAAPGWVLRGAYGIFYSHTVRMGLEGTLATALTASSATTTVTDPKGNVILDGYQFGLLTSMTRGYGTTQAATTQYRYDPNTLAPTVQRRAQDPNRRSAYIQQFNFGIQRELTRNLLFDIAYTGNKGTKLPGFRNINPNSVITAANSTQSAGPRPYAAFGDIHWLENRVNSSFNSMQLGLEKRFSQGLSALLSYTSREDWD